MKGNIIVILADSWRYDHFGFTGSKVKTPNIDKLAGESALFDKAYADNLPTLPNRTSLFTGCFSWPWQGWQPLPHDKPIIADIFKEEGYTTAIITDSFPLFMPGYNYTKGFQNVKCMDFQYGEPLPLRLKNITIELKPYLPPHLAADSPHKREGHIRELKGVLQIRSEWKGLEDVFSAKVVKGAIKWLEQRDKRNPFFLWLDCFDPHEPWDPRGNFESMYEKPDVGWIPVHPSAGSVDELSYTDEELKAIQANYAGMCSQTDYWLGYFLDYLRSEGLLDKSFLCFTSDHGEPLGRGRWGHGIVRKVRPWPFEELSHIPLLIRHPEGYGASQRFSTFVQPFDITATLLDFAGIDKEISGESLLNVIQGKVSLIRDCAFSGHYKKSRSIRTDEWFYGEWEGEKYLSIAEDRYQLQNLIKENRSIAEKLQKKVDEFIASTT